MARPLEHLSDEALVLQATAGQDPGQAPAMIETLFRTRDALVRQQKATNLLTERIEQLNWWLLVFTLAMAMIAAFQFGDLLRSLVAGR